MKSGDLITAEYKWNNEYLPCIGYIYKDIKYDDLYIGASCKNGGCNNFNLKELKNIKVIKVEKTEEEMLNYPHEQLKMF